MVRLQVGHGRGCRGEPADFQRMPPSSQIERSDPHVAQRASHDRDSASIDCAQERGTSTVISLWMKLTSSLRPIGAIRLTPIAPYDFVCPSS